MERILTLHFIDGTKLSLAFEEQGNSAARKLKVEKLMTSKHLVVEAEGSVMIFPVANIKYMAISGAIPGAGSRRSRATPSPALVYAPERPRMRLWIGTVATDAP